jgi:iron complex transport system substrate-binding protein
MKPTKQVLTLCVPLAILGLLGYAFMLSTKEGPEAILPDSSLQGPWGAPPARIVSLVPAVTEILFALGAAHRLVGRTHWGTYPPAVKMISDVGDGMRPSLEVVLSVEPDIVLLYDGAGNRNVARRFESLGVNTLSIRHDTLFDLETNIALLGDLVGCPRAAAELLTWIRIGLEEVAQVTAQGEKITVYWDAWAEPPITIGAGSFLDSLLRIAGAENIFSDQSSSAPRVSLESIIYRDPEMILVPMEVSSAAVEPSLAKRPGWERVPAVKAGRVWVLDQDLMSRLGPRVVEAAWVMARTIHPDLVQEGVSAKILVEPPPCNG